MKRFKKIRKHIIQFVVGYTQRLHRIYKPSMWKYYPDILYHKWVKLECPHFCFMCEFADMCYENTEMQGGFRK